VTEYLLVGYRLQDSTAYAGYPNGKFHGILTNNNTTRQALCEGGTFVMTTAVDRFLAAICEACPLCRHARRKPDGMANRLVRNVEEKLCPFCRAYARVYGTAAHEAVRAGKDID